MGTRTVTVIVALAFGAACGRTELDPGKPGQPSSEFGGSSLSGSRTSTAGSGGAAGMGGATATGGTTTNLGDTTTACPQPAKPSCRPGPPSPTRLTTQDKDWTIDALASSGEDLFIASTFSYATSLRGRIVHLSLGSLATDTHEHWGTQTGLRYQAQAVIYKPSFYNPSQPFDYYSPSVVLWDLQTGKETDLPNPEGFKIASSRSLAGNSKGEVFWAPYDDNKAIVQWDPCTGKTEVLRKGSDVVVLLADESTIYWQEPKGGEYAYPYRTLLYALPIKGGAASLLLDIPMASWRDPVLLALDDERLYYMDPSLGVMSMTKQGGDKQSVLPQAKPLRLDSSTIDGTHIYWVASDDPSTLRRTPKHGGETVVWWTAEGRPIQAIGADACNVYWALSNPQEVHYRSK